MNLNPQIMSITSLEQAQRELTKLNCDPAGIRIMADKAVFKVFKLENISTKAANLLKQTFLAKGGEVAVARGTADLSAAYTDVLIMATLKQYKAALSQLKLQPWGLPDIAGALEKALASGGVKRQYRWPDGRSLTLTSRKTLVMGILNVTPDSFSDGGCYNTLEAAARHAEEMIQAGADIIDIGAESTRPYGGAQVVSAREELDRLLPLLEKVLKIATVPVSVDTYKASVAEAAIKMGAHLINDVWGLQSDPGMAGVIANYKVPVIVMHNQQNTFYEKDIMYSICRFLQQSIQIGLDAGVPFDHFIIDPGIGFGKTPEQNLEVMSRLGELRSLGCPLLLGTSRKRFIGEVLGLPVEDRVEGTGATVAWGIAQGTSIVRVHDVKPIVRMAKMCDAMKGESFGER